MLAAIDTYPGALEFRKPVLSLGNSSTDINCVQMKVNTKKSWA